MTWREDGICSDNPHWDHGLGIPQLDDRRRADCAVCDVRVACLAAGITDARENPGGYRDGAGPMWGGKTAIELGKLAGWAGKRGKR